MQIESTLINLNDFTNLCMIADHYKMLVQQGWNRYFRETPKPASDLGLYFSGDYIELAKRPKFWTRLIDFAFFSGEIEPVNNQSPPMVEFLNTEPCEVLATRAVFAFVDDPHLVLRMAAMENSLRHQKENPTVDQNFQSSLIFPWRDLDMKLNIWVDDKNIDVVFGIYGDIGLINNKGTLIIREVNFEITYERDGVEITCDPNCGNKIAYESSPPRAGVLSRYNDVSLLQARALSKIFSLRPNRTLISNYYVSDNAVPLVDTRKFELIPAPRLFRTVPVFEPVKCGN